MPEVKAGDTVRIHYTGTLADGSVFDSSQGRAPLQFKVGSGEIIPGLDAALPGMAVGATQRVDVPAAAAYGAHDPGRVGQIPRGEVPADIPLDIGTPLTLRGSDGQNLSVRVAAVSEEAVTLDANHPLAGQDLTFEVELVEIV